MKRLPALVACALFLLMSGCAHAASPASLDQPPPAPREFRAAWVATVGNSTWPRDPDMSVAEQKQAMIDILDRAVALHLNAIVFQVRTQCDALYDSKIEPWSEYLTGTEGKAPDPYWDPLATWVEEAHKRGLELHAWFNPYRARSGNSFGDRAANHVSKVHPEIVRTYGNELWLDPGDPATIDYSLSVMMDVVKRYDVDGVHMDDYFYPYKTNTGIASTYPTTRPASSRPARRPSTTSFTSGPTSRGFSRRPRGERSSAPNLDFPDNVAWARYQQSGGKLSRDDWRRQNVNTLIKRLYDSIKAEKKFVKLGISPFGIWRPKNPPGVTGLDAYDQLYADSRLWFSKGWCDYFTPQLYWPMEGPQSFSALFAWWGQQNQSKRYLWPGISVGRRDAKETLRQIDFTRNQPNPGVVHWSMGSLMRNRELDDALLDGPYKSQALIPASTWLDNQPPPQPRAVAQKNPDGSVTLHITASAGEQPVVWAIYTRYGQTWKFSVEPATKTQLTLPADPRPGSANPPILAVAVSAVDRCGNESPRLIIKP